MDLFKRFVRYYAPHKKMLALDMLASLLISVIGMVYPIVTNNMLNIYIPQKMYGTIVIAGVSGVMPTSPLEMESVGKIVTKPAPMVGHDTVAVLQDLGYSDDEIAHMNDSGAIYSEK